MKQNWPTFTVSFLVIYCRNIGRKRETKRGRFRNLSEHHMVDGTMVAQTFTSLVQRCENIREKNAADKNSFNPSCNCAELCESQTNVHIIHVYRK